MNALKLNQLEKNTLSEKEMNNLNGGNWICKCSCYYQDSGGSSIDDNMSANAALPGGRKSGEGDNANQIVVCTP
ncbi:MAG: TIGR04149 family rSAM-modified RiPP [Bacteroidales bacterium]